MVAFYQNGSSESVFDTSARIYQMRMLLNPGAVAPA